MVFSLEVRHPFREFHHWRFAKVTIPPIYGMISKLPFDGRPRLTRATLPDGTMQEVYGFYDCPSLTTMAMPASVVIVGYQESETGKDAGFLQCENH
jgi:hypothetical protein